MYSINNNVAIIDGRRGKYDRQVNNVDVRYGRNANSNYKSYIKDLGKKEKSVPLEFEYRYMPNQSFNRLALMGSAYEEMGKHTKLKTELINKEFSASGMDGYSADALDLNQDGYVDVAEYATNTLAQDIMSSSDGFSNNMELVDGVINSKGEQRAFALNNKYIIPQAREFYGELYENFELAAAQKEFLSDSNNLV